MTTSDLLRARVDALRHKEPVPDDLQSDLRMAFNEAMAGGPNTNGDAGYIIHTVGHAHHMVRAIERIAALTRTPTDRNAVLEEAARVADRNGAMATAEDIRALASTPPPADEQEGEVRDAD